MSKLTTLKDDRILKNGYADGWYLAFENSVGWHVIRGPYKCSHAAGEVRSEIERSNWADDKNIKVIEKNAASESETPCPAPQ